MQADPSHAASAAPEGPLLPPCPESRSSLLVNLVCGRDGSVGRTLQGPGAACLERGRQKSGPAGTRPAAAGSTHRRLPATPALPLPHSLMPRYMLNRPGTCGGHTRR